MPYNSNATDNLIIDNESTSDWNRAFPGQWFIGVIDTELKSVKIAPVNVFDDRDGKLNQSVLFNTSQRGRNRYASGAPGERSGNSIMPDYLRNRRSGVTHHTAVCEYAGFEMSNSLGFSIIKINDNFAQLKSSSTSLNGDKPGHRINHSFSRMTGAGLSNTFFPTSAMMPILWVNEIKKFLSQALEIKHICVSED